MMRRYSNEQRTEGGKGQRMVKGAVNGVHCPFILVAWTTYAEKVKL